jgi:hypothetical protein
MQPLYGLPCFPSNLQDSLPPLISGTTAGAGWRVSWRAPAESKPHGNVGQAPPVPPTPWKRTLTREAKGGAGWRVLFLHNIIKVIWHHACKVIAIYTELQFQVEMRSICQIHLKSIWWKMWPWKWGHELEPQPALQSHSSPCPPGHAPWMGKDEPQHRFSLV